MSADQNLASSREMSDLKSVRAQSLMRKLAPLARAASSTKNVIKYVTIGFAIAAACVWYLIFVPFPPASLLAVAVAALVGLALLIPSAVWGLLFLAVGQVIELPSRLGRIAEGGRDQLQVAVKSTADPAKKGIIRRLSGLLRSLLQASGTFSDARVLLVESSALLRIFNPVTLAVVAVTFVLGLGLVAISVISIAVASAF